MKVRALLIVGLLAFGCSNQNRHDPIVETSRKIEIAEQTLSTLRDTRDEEHADIKAQWVIIADLEKRLIEEVGKARRSLEVVDGGAPWTLQLRYTLADDHLIVERRGPRDRPNKSEGRTFVELKKCQCF